MDIKLVSHAKDYIDDLAKGINPFTKEEIDENDIVNQVKISRCLFFVSEVLEEVIANGGVGTKKKEKLLPFDAGTLDLSAFDYSSDPIGITEITRRINALKPDNMQKLKLSALSEWLIDIGMLELVVAGGKSKKRPTLQGTQLGIGEVERFTQNGTFKAIVFDETAQRFILDHLPAVIEAGYNASASSRAEKLKS